jgi:pilus assembly protein CpaE
MVVQLQAIVVDADANNRQEMSTFLANYGVNVVAQVPAVDALTSMLGRSDSPQLVVVNLDPSPHETLKRVAEMVRRFAAASFFVLSQAVDSQLLMEAIHVGVREFVPLPINAEKFAAGIDKVGQLYGMGKRARVIQVVPTVGGCGSTTVACNVAASLAKSFKAAIVDMDLIGGAVASSFDLRPRYTIADVMESAQKLDRQMLDNALAVHAASKLSILGRPELPEDSQRVTQGGVTRLLSVLGRVFDYVVVDSLMSIDPLYVAATQAADLTVVVMQLNVPSAKNAERYVGALRRMGTEASKIRLVVNRFVKKGCDIAPEEVERALGLKISWLIPNDFKNAIAAINFGEPVVLRSPRCDMSASLSGLAESLNGRTVAQAA